MRDRYQGEDLDLGLLARFLAEYKGLVRQRRQCLTGGEPTVYRDLDGLMQVFRQTGMSNYVVTNAQSERGVAAVLRHRDVVDWVSVSLEGPTAEVNDLIRGAGSFAKAIQAVRTYKAQGMEVDFRMVLHDANVPFIGQMFELAQALQVNRLRFSSLHAVEKALRGRLSASREILDRARQQIRLLEKEYPQIRVGFNTRHTLPDTAPEWSPERCVPIIGPLNGITLLPDGKVSFCCDVYDLDFPDDRYEGENAPLDPIVGDYTRESLTVIAERKRALIEELQRRRVQDAAQGRLAHGRQYICENCKYYFYRRGITRGEAPPSV
jgi:MoaA/NifB/PqqE/SkfB family radical SAM enzyme